MKKYLLLSMILLSIFMLSSCKKNDYKKAIKFYEAGEYDNSIELFEKISDYNDSSEWIKKAKYKKAEKYYNVGEYDNAIALFGEIESYNDSIEMVKKIKYEKMAFEDCNKLRKMCVDPTSFMLYDDVYIDELEERTLVYISYGAKNGFGVMTTGFAIFDGEQYRGDWSDEEDDFSSQKEYDYFLTECKVSLAISIVASEVAKIYGTEPVDICEDLIKINCDKLGPLLGVKYDHIVGIHDLSN